MSSGFSWQKYQFITTVQTILTNNAINLSLEPDQAIKLRHLISATGIAGTMGTAFRAAERLPADQDAHEAALQFIAVVLRSQFPNDPEPLVPAWLYGQ